MFDRVKDFINVRRRREPKHATPRTILIVDGNAKDRRTTADRVIRLGYEALEADSVAKALQQLDEHDPACVLLAFDLKDGKGFAGLDRIRERDATLEVVMLATDWRDSRTAEAMRRGAVAYLAKPFSQDDLRELLARR